ncbi:hypothetical protein CNBF3070 [Cryptococcus deneoformans B-3501A]|uniref:hypothetical protein n=1 Tax=Cryptococcus deneoformans (strain B-3501A) TaxID=283643 RepID=UPI000042EC34|nr:hypothetical protein CNBF3070 [Cryptococcus neoformans var. neoformans B-3501A]EAL19980.1 hypothetical protein CNBF3070 [Cryptococcus neoformans var. neoformans B-3501A]
MTSSNEASCPRSRQNSTTSLNNPAGSPSSRKTSHSRNDSEVIAASGVRHPSANHRPNASLSGSPGHLRPRSSRTASPVSTLSRRKSSPNLSVPPSGRNMFGGDGSHTSGAERIIKGTSKWLRDKMGSGGEKNDHWLVLDLPSPSMLSDAGSMAIPVYDTRGYPSREGSLDRPPVAADAGTRQQGPALTSGPEINVCLSQSTKNKPSPLGYTHNASLTPLAAQFPARSASPLNASLPSLADFYPDTVVFGNRTFGSDPRPALSVFGSSGSSIMTIRSISSLRSGFGTDTDSAARFRLDSDAGSDEGLIDREAMLKRHAAKRAYGMKNILPKSRLVNELEGNEEKRGLYDLLPFHIDPSQWEGANPEDDDELHRPESQDELDTQYFSSRGLANLGCLAIMGLAVVILFAGLPIFEYYITLPADTHGGFNIGGINSTGQVPDVANIFQLIDPDTPPEAYTHKSLDTGEEWDLVFSDEFNEDGRTFYNGDDPFWEAADLHYWQTNNLEWYDPSRLTTKNGKLVITLDEIFSHGMNFEGGMMSSWNRFCFTGVSVSLPGTNDIPGLWPAVWAMGNLGRAGYGGSLDGTWPYTYDSCDVGTLPNQTLNGKPTVALTQGDPGHNNELSYLPGQRLSRCTCPDDDTHPGPKHSDGSFVGRSAPEIDIFEATLDMSIGKGQVSQSGQWAPFNPNYHFINSSSKYYEIYDNDVTQINTYMGSVYQQATSGLSLTNQVSNSTDETGCFAVYGMEYAPGADGYITWVNDNKKAWTVRGAAMGPNKEAGVDQRLVTEEPMYMVLNLGISENFGAVHFVGLQKLWPVQMEVDYVRVYQDPKKKNIGCDPADRPTASYISRFPEAYSNANIVSITLVISAAQVDMASDNFRSSSE